MTLKVWPFVELAMFVTPSNEVVPCELVPTIEMPNPIAVVRRVSMRKLLVVPH